MFDFIFAMRPSVICNMKCSYCYRQDYLNVGNKQIRYDIDSMLWHSNQRPNNLFILCGLGETMLHPQFSEMIIELSKVTKVNWVTNGTCFESKSFENILNNANLSNIHDVIVSIHFGQIKDMDSYSKSIQKVFFELTIRKIKVHLTTIVTDDNVDAIIKYRYLFPLLVIKQPFKIYVQNRQVINNTYSESTLEKLKNANINPSWDYSGIEYPYIGKVCPNGAKIAEVMHDGKIYDCSFDENRVLIGDLNIKEPIKMLDYPRHCKTNCMECIPVLRDGYNLLN